MRQPAQYDTAIIGGGVGGLALAILLARAGKRVILYEKESYPFHKVCGEYISAESIPFLQSLGVDFDNPGLPRISKLVLTSPSGIRIQRPLDIGGTGISRYMLDSRLAQLAEASGVVVASPVKVTGITTDGLTFTVKSGPETIVARTVAGAWGKHANIDAQLGRDYKAKSRQDLYVAVKHHIQADYDPAIVEIHNFSGGYCGMSAIENGMVNMSYIVTADRLRLAGGIGAMEQTVLSGNPFLKHYFKTAHFIFRKPLTISHLHFGLKVPVTDGILMLGDAAGNIAPLSGNGMSMSLRSASLASTAIMAYLDGSLTQEAMEAQYAREYANAFSRRVMIARQIQFLFGKPGLTDFGFRLLRLFPGMVDAMGKLIHGVPF